VKILHLSFSPRGPASESRALARKMLSHLFARYPNATLIERMLGEDPLPHIDADYALAQHSAIAEVHDQGSTARSDAAIAELHGADLVVISTPMHNLTVPSALKSWLDHVVRARSTFDMTSEGKKGKLRDRPVLVAVASGGRFSGERARQPDFLTPYLLELLKMVGLRDVHFFSIEGTGAAEESVARAREEAGLELDRFFETFARDS
jgi:FMN-dependent NADH-azoreductase